MERLPRLWRSVVAPSFASKSASSLRGSLQSFCDAILKSAKTRRKVNGHLQAHLIATACGPAPEGQQRWTLRLLADYMVQLDYADQISYETVRQVLKKTN
jgi:hypothetical protein